MNTRTSEIRLILTEIIRESLRQGIVPDFMDLVTSQEYHDIGEVKPTNLIMSNVAESSEINSSLDAVGYNLEILDESARLQVEDTIKHRKTFLSRFNRLDRWYRKLAYRVQSLILLTRTGTKSLYSVSDTFSSIGDVDLDNTTAYIDTLRGIAEIPFDAVGNYEDAESGTANISISRVTINDAGLTQDIISPSNEFYYKHISESRDGVELEIEMKVERRHEIYDGGRVEFGLGFPENTDIVSVIGTSDFKNFEDLPYFQKSNNVFIPVSKLYQDKTITILLRKNNHEGEKIDDNGTVRHQFIFDLNKLRIPDRRYRESAVLQSNVFALPEALSTKGISQYAVFADILGTGDTKVDTSISFSGGAFMLVPVNTIMPIGEVANEQTYHPACTITREVPSPICKLEGTSNTPVQETAVLFEGWNQAEVESQDYTVSASELTHWVSVHGTKEYQDMKVAGIYLSEGLSHKIYFKINSKYAQDIVLSNLGVISQEEPDFNQAEYMKMYFNGQKLSGKTLPDETVEYRLPLVEGDNTVNLLIGLETSDNGGYLNLGGQFENTDTEIFVKKRAATSMAAILNMDPVDRSYCVYNNNVYINYIPANNAKFMHRYSLPTTALPSSVAIRFNMQGAGGVSPMVMGYRIEFSTGSEIE